MPLSNDCNGAHQISLIEVEAPGKAGAKTKQNTLHQSINMKFTKSLLAVTVVALTTALKAASINYEVQVAGYSTAGWIKVRPELRGILGGRVANLPQYGGWVTDRVSRGENLRISILPDNRVERKCRLSLVGVIANNDLVSLQGALLPVTGVWNVTRNPNIDNVYLAVVTETGLYEKRVPIGSR